MDKPKQAQRMFLCCLCVFKWAIKSYEKEDFPGGPVAENLPCNAGDSGSIPGQGRKISHATDQLSPHTTIRESMGCTKDPMCHN